ncbi:restriction endonuclease subunit S [Ruminococcus flavefaciens]|uniref:Type I restriction enzyme, S subunit n=1 Tax=Ruminococcus flavefaciens TaxID=1265 RepID=A0A1K1MH28_RUMFL|nr:restriction endonuclease subunit S [Ruminococcus flavefaciens]SFW22469.1 type I restriction enzyme, S subunit [Ruminococcus flavefaciens]
MRKAPDIRFKEFTDAWEQRKLGSIADKVTEKNGQLSYSETFTNSAEFGIISQRDFFDHDISNSENIGGYYVVRDNDFVYNPRISVTAPCGPINCNRLGRNGVMSPLYTVFKTHDIDTLYLEWFFKSSYWHSFMYYNGDSGARSDRFSIKNDLFFMMPIPVPTEEEQRRIGSLLSTLDKAITLHQRKLEKLQLIKEAMLDKMFPKNGESVPKIRFKGFKGDWEYKELGEVFSEYSEKNHQELPPLTIIQGQGTIKRSESNRNVSYDESSLSGYKLVRENDFIVHLRSFEGGLEKANSDGIVSPAYHVLQGNSIDCTFYYLFFRSYDFIFNRLKNCVYGIRDGKSIDIAEMKKIKIPYTSIEEQKKIGEYFSNLDEMIMLYKKKHTKLKQFKEAMLDKMFI